MFKAIPKQTIVASIRMDGRMVASGLGILDRSHVGLYAIYVDACFRRKNFAKAQGCSVKDLNSRNGTFCNGERLRPQGQRTIQEGDIIAFAEIEYRRVSSFS